jgi:hypothetical protein
MNIPRFWARSTAEAFDPSTKETHKTSACGHSDVSIEDARRDALSRAQRCIAWLLSDREEELDKYGYDSGRPLREAVVRELMSDGARVAAITRNGYGALVLNAAHVVFIDVDDERPSPIDVLAKLFGKKKKASPDATIRRAIEETPGLGARLYRTAGGWRCLITSQLAEPTEPAVDELMSRCGADPRYRLLCRNQESFRARLTPKPYRCALPNPPVKFPFADAAAEARYAEWLKRYEGACSGFAVCELVETIGVKLVDPIAATIMREHDAATLRAGKQLA